MKLDIIYPAYDTDPTYREAEAWAKTFFQGVQDQEDADFNSQAIYDLAREKYTRLINAREILEKKAAGVVVFVMTATTVLASTVAQGSLLNISLAFIGIAVLSSLMVLFPSDWPSSLSIRDALETCEYNQQKQCAQLSASLHCSIIGARLIVNAKSHWMACGYVAAIIGTMILVFLRIYYPH